MENATVLVVDDERFFISLLSNILASNYSVLTASNGDEALLLLKQHAVDLILLDIIMPQMDGFEICKCLKKNSATKDIPIIFLTVKDDVDDELKGLELGAVDYLIKPISPAVVLARVKTHVMLKQAQQKLLQYSNELESLVSQRTQELRQEVSNTQKAYEKLNYLANYDQLTHLPNRNLFNERLAYACKQAQRNGTEFALMLIDLDRFKQVNDAFGHHVGDLLLEEVAKRLTDNLREVDTVARLGGDEFTVIINELKDKATASLVAGKIIEQFRQPFQIDNHLVFITASIGITIFPLDGGKRESILQLADMAMYEAKDQGKNTYGFYTSRLTEYITQRQEIEKDLYKAIINDELFLHYQPIYDIETHRFCGAEALLRWNSPKHGQVSPEQLVSIAEESDLILEIGDWVLRTVSKQVSQWHEVKNSKDFFIAVNVSPRQFSAQKGGVSHIDSTLQEMHFPNGLLILEITENLILEKSERIYSSLNKLRDAGVKLAIDDFGTGYSSLSYLRQFPVDGIKIDRSFIQDLDTDTDADSSVLVKTVLAMGKSLNLRVVAEGVETQEQFAFLKENGCDMVQGHFFSRPVVADDLVQIMHAPLTGKFQMESVKR